MEHSPVAPLSVTAEMGAPSIAVGDHNAFSRTRKRGGHTCSLLWLAHADPRLSDSCVVEIENAAAKQRLYLSTISL